jgi:hypothetical protein
VDRELGKVLYHEAPPKQTRAPDLDHAAELLVKERARRESLFAESAEEEKVKSQLLERKFEESLKKTQKEPITRPTRDIDLD